MAGPEGIGTRATSGWRRYARPGTCEGCGSDGSKRTLYSAPMNRHDPDEGLLVMCFVCLVGEQEQEAQRLAEMYGVEQ